MVPAQRQKYRSIVQDRKSRDIPTVYGPLVYDDEGKNIQQRKDRLFKMLWLEKRTATCKRMKLEHSLTSHTKIKSKWIKDLNGRPDTIRLL